MAGRGRKPGFKMPEEHRTKIANSKIFQRLIGCAEGTVEMNSVQVTAAIALMKKVLPDMTYNEHGGLGGGAIQFEDVTIYEGKP